MTSTVGILAEWAAHSQAYWDLRWSDITAPTAAPPPSPSPSLSELTVFLRSVLRTYVATQVSVTRALIDERPDSYTAAFQHCSDLLAQASLLDNLARPKSKGFFGRVLSSSRSSSSLSSSSTPPLSATSSDPPVESSAISMPALLDASALDAAMDQSLLTPEDVLFLPSLCTVLSGTVKLFEAFLNFLRGNLLKGATRIVSAWKTTASVATSSGSGLVELMVRSELLLMLGFYNFFLSLIPRKFHWILNMLGFPTDRGQGIQALNACSASRLPAATTADLLLLWASIFYFDDAAEQRRLVEQALSRRGSAVFFRYLIGYAARENGANSAAQAEFRFVEQAAAGAAFRQLQLDAMYERGWTHYRSNEFEAAAELFEAFLAESPIAAFRCYCAWQHGVALDMLGQYDRAAAWMSRVRDFRRKEYSFDSYAVRKAAEYLAPGGAPFNRVQRNLVLLTGMSKQRPTPADALALVAETRALIDLDAPDGHPLRADYLVELLLLHATIQSGDELLQERRDPLLHVVQLAPSVKAELHMVIQALFQLAKDCWSTGDRTAARQYLARAKLLLSKSVDFEKPLHREFCSLDDRFSTSE